AHRHRVWGWRIVLRDNIGEEDPCEPENIIATLERLEDTGFYGLVLEPESTIDERCRRLRYAGFDMGQRDVVRQRDSLQIRRARFAPAGQTYLRGDHLNRSLPKRLGISRPPCIARRQRW